MAVDCLKRLFTICDILSDQQNIIVETQDFNESLFSQVISTPLFLDLIVFVERGGGGFRSQCLDSIYSLNANALLQLPCVWVPFKIDLEEQDETVRGVMAFEMSYDFQDIINSSNKRYRLVVFLCALFRVL